MKQSFYAVTNCSIKAIMLFLDPFKWSITIQLCLVMLTGLSLFTSCKKQDAVQPKAEIQSVSDADINSTADFGRQQLKTIQELIQAREATIRYKDINNAIHDGYVDIHVVMENMGYHYQKVSIVDSVFDVKHPELLVYNKNSDGTFRLVAVEYAVPLDKSANAPAGFTGNKDVWDHNDGFGLWLLHAWVWDFNPDGVFNPTNTRVHVVM